MFNIKSEKFRGERKSYAKSHLMWLTSFQGSCNILISFFTFCSNSFLFCMFKLLYVKKKNMKRFRVTIVEIFRGVYACWVNVGFKKILLKENKLRDSSAKSFYKAHQSELLQNLTSTDPPLTQHAKRAHPNSPFCIA